MKDHNHRLIAEGEHQRLDFKFEIADARKIARTLVAFANTDGGRLLIGVKDNGAIAGVRSDEEYYMLEAAAGIYCKPAVSFEFKEWNINGKTVLVSGCGPIGVMAIGVAKAMGAKAIYATDISDYRLSLAKVMNPTATLNAKDPEMFAKLNEATKGLGFDVLLEMSGAPQAMEDGFKALFCRWS